MSENEAAAVLQLLKAQGAMQGLLMQGFAWSFEQCTSAGSGPQLSAKERRCIQSGIATFIDSRSHMAQHMAQLQQNGGRDL
jgi:hypothetical protein